MFEQDTRDEFNTIINKSIGVGIDNYRRIMKYYYENLGFNYETIAIAMKDSVGAGEINYKAS